MSLRSFHLFFIGVSILLAFGFAAWEFAAFAREKGALDFVLGAGSLLGGVGLVFYFRSVQRKLRDLDRP